MAFLSPGLRRRSKDVARVIKSGMEGERFNVRTIRYRLQDNLSNGLRRQRLGLRALTCHYIKFVGKTQDDSLGTMVSVHCARHAAERKPHGLDKRGFSTSARPNDACQTLGNGNAQARQESAADFNFRGVDSIPTVHQSPIGSGPGRRRKRPKTRTAANVGDKMRARPAADTSLDFRDPSGTASEA
jgi:hypothetical protein